MGRIVVHLFGKPKDTSQSSIIDDYSNRLQNRGVSLKFHSDKKSKLDYEQLLSSFPGKLMLIDEKGNQITSKKLSELVSQILLDSQATNFAIGPPDGFSKEFKSKINNSISLSKMTFTHEMAASILLEQLYRATEIVRGSSYHRE